MKFNKSVLPIIGIATLAIGLAACSSASTNTAANVGNKSANSINNTANSNPNANTVGNQVSSSLATPRETLAALHDGVMRKDEAAVRRTLSSKIQTEIDNALAKSANDPEMKKRGITDFMTMLNAAITEMGGEIAKPDVVNEKISGEVATLEVKDQKTGKTAPVTLVKESGEWKVALPNEVSQASAGNAQAKTAAQ